MNGEIIHMSSWMNCMFETDILDKASPATVGRCGMVYMDTNNLGWRPLKESFLAELPRVSINEEHVENLDELFEWLVQPCLDMVKQQGTFINSLCHLPHSHCTGRGGFSLTFAISWCLQQLHLVPT